MRKFDNKEKLRNRLAAFKRFNDWEKEHADVIEAGEALASIGAIYNLMPPESRNSSPNLRGIKLMQSAFSHIRVCR
jgi:hypothetical protein